MSAPRRSFWAGAALCAATTRQMAAMRCLRNGMVHIVTSKPELSLENRDRRVGLRIDQPVDDGRDRRFLRPLQPALEIGRLLGSYFFAPPGARGGGGIDRTPEDSVGG